jgi:hypothetical protein
LQSGSWNKKYMKNWDTLIFQLILYRHSKLNELKEWSFDFKINFDRQSKLCRKLNSIF